MQPDTNKEENKRGECDAIPYCPNCGNEVTQSAKFCRVCGTKLSEPATTPRQAPVSPPAPTPPPAPATVPAPPVTLSYPMKNEGTAALLAGLIGLVLLGIGHFYTGKILRGIGFLITGLILDGLFLGLLVGAPGAALAIGLIAIIVWILSIYDAYNLAKEYNQHLRTTGQPPW